MKIPHILNAKQRETNLEPNGKVLLGQRLLLCALGSKLPSPSLCWEEMLT